MERIDFEKFFKIQTIGMNLTFVHPNLKHDIYWLIKTFLLYVGFYSFFLVFLANSMIIDLKKNDYFNVFRNAVPVTIYICVMFDYSVLIKNNKVIGKLIKLMKADLEKVPDMDIRQKTIIFDYMAKSTWIMENFLKLMLSSLGTFVLKSIILTIYYAAIGDAKLVPYHEMYFTEYIDKRRQSNLFYYAITYLGGAAFTSVCALIYLCALPLGPIFMLHVCGLLGLIIIKLENIFDKDNVDERLKEVIKDLNYAYRFVIDINTCFTFMYEIMLKQTAILLPITCYAMVKSISRGQFQIEYATLVAGAVSMSLPCYYSDLLMSKGEEVRQAIYSCGWERVYLPRERKTLLVLLTRATKPITIRSIFHIINLDTLSDVYRQAFNLFNLMNAMWD